MQAVNTCTAAYMAHKSQCSDTMTPHSRVRKDVVRRMDAT